MWQPCGRLQNYNTIPKPLDRHPRHDPLFPFFDFAYLGHVPPVFLPPRLADGAFLRFLLPGFKPEPAAASGPNASSCPSQIRSPAPVPASASSSYLTRDSYRRTPAPFLNPSDAARSIGRGPAMGAPNAGGFTGRSPPVR